MEKPRKIIIFETGLYIRKNQPDVEPIAEGFYHGYGAVADREGACLIAVVEYPNGCLDYISVDRIQFVDPLK